MSNYLGIIIQQSLANPDFAREFPVVATKRPGSWVFLLAAIAEAGFAEHVRQLQANMVDDDNWYAHYFRDEELVVVFRDAVFRVTTDPASWGPAVAHGLAAGIPREQLDFTPRTREDAARFFEISPT